MARRPAATAAVRRPAPEVVRGTARTDRRTKDLVKRLRPGEVAVIDHRDLDTVAAETLAEAGIAGIVNAAPSSSGRYPNDGPLIVLRAGIALVDDVGPEVMERIAEGAEVVIDGAQVLVDGEVVATGTRQSVASIEAIHESSRATLGAEFIRFVENTVGYLDDNQDLLSDDLALPPTKVDFEGRHVLIVVRGHDYRSDLQLLRDSGYVGEQRPVLVGVDGGADALLDMGMRPDVIVGDFDSVSERALRCGAELIVHAFRDGRAPGAARLDELGVAYELFPASGTSEDIAMLLAYNSGAELIVAVGTHTSMVDFLDKGRSGMASTFLTRMKVGPALVDARGVSRLYHSAIRKRDLLLLVVGAALALLIVFAASAPVRLIVHSIWSDLTG